MRSLVVGVSLLVLVALSLSSCQPDRGSPTGPQAPLDPAAKFVVSATITPAPGQTGFAPFGDWKSFHVSVNLSDLNPVRVRVNPRDLASTRVLEISNGASPPSYDYCGNGAEWNDYRTVRADRPVYLAACQAGPAVLVVETGSGTRLDTLRFEVIDPDAEPEFNIELVFVDPAAWTTEQKGVFEQAAQRWEAIITEDMPDADFSQWPFDSRDDVDGWVSSGRYDRLGHIQVNDEVDDLRVFVGRALSGDDEPWGLAGIIRRWSDSKLPVLSSINIHEELFEAPWLDSGTLLGVIEHELGHTLGFAGGRFEELNLLGLSSRDTPRDTYFYGIGAQSAFSDAGGWFYSGNKVPIENDLAMAVDSHWRERVFGAEVMSSRGIGREPISAITIQALADIGYTVDVTQADPYTLPWPTVAAKPVVATRPFCQVLRAPFNE